MSNSSFLSISYQHIENIYLQRFIQKKNMIVSRVNKTIDRKGKDCILLQFLQKALDNFPGGLQCKLVKVALNCVFNKADTAVHLLIIPA